MFMVIIVIKSNVPHAMDRMNQRSAMAYWKLSTIVVVFVGVTSYLSVRAHESSKLPREHILKYSELLREPGAPLPKQQS